MTASGSVRATATQREAPRMPPVPKRGRLRLPTETEFKRDLTKALNAAPGIYVWRNASGCIRSGKAWLHLAPKGSGDLIGVVKPDGLLLSIECKVGKAKDNGTGTLDAQEAWAHRMADAGAVHVTAQMHEDETLVEAVARCVRLVLDAVEERRSRDACGAAEAAIAGDVSEAGDVGAEVNMDGSEALLAALRDAPKRAGSTR